MKRVCKALLGISLCLGLLWPGAAQGADAPGWSIGSLAVPTNFAPGGEGTYEIRATNIGAASTDGTAITITDSLPAGLTVEHVQLRLPTIGGGGTEVGPTACQVQGPPESQSVTCVLSPTVVPSESLIVSILVAVAPTASGDLVNSASAEGGGAAAAAGGSLNQATPAPAAAGLSSFTAEATGPEGEPAGEAASHPFQYTTAFAINTEPGPTANPPIVPADGDVKDIEVKLPPGLIGNPLATPRCTPQDFFALDQSEGNHPANACPDASAVGFIALQQLEGAANRGTGQPLYNMVPPKGMPAEFGFQVGSVPFFIDTGVRTGSDNGISAYVRNTSQFRRITASSVTIWGVPADPRHDQLRGHCINNGSIDAPLSRGACSAGEAPRPLLRMPTSCSNPLVAEMTFNLWNAKSTFFSSRWESDAPSGCNGVEFEPTLEARPTTDVADAPTGLHAQLHIPQNEGFDERSTADLRSTVVTLPEGLIINPAGANGLGACSASDVGLTSAPGASPITFTTEPAHCPEQAKIGIAQVDTPLLDHPLKGGVYVARPYENPFGGLLGIYLVLEDPETGIVLKLPGEVNADPQTGRLTTTFDETPQLPFEDFTLDFFGGAAAVLRTPATCGPYATASTMTPYSAPESGPPVADLDNYAIARSPGAGGCPTSAGSAEHAPTLEAGTQAPIAGAFSPFVLRLHREDATQELSRVTLNPPPGLLARLAGVPYCSEAALAAAATRPGKQESAAPSCPAASQVGTVSVGAGAGPAPYFVQGSVYLAGPYNGAPLSLAIVTPATAGPYDLGTVVVRTALRVDPETARITAVSDPIPHILQGISLDVRTITLRLDRPNFSLNPTNCNPLVLSGEVISTLGQGAALQNPFQVGECGALAFKPKLSLRLKGKTRRSGNPALQATLRMPPGANVAHASVALPRSEFLDQAHIRTICTRVQYAAGDGGGKACPPGSIYGYARAVSPLLDQPLQGPVYLRSSDNELPDLVAALDGQIHIDLVGRIDSFKGGIRTTFESVPDAPVSTFTLSMQGGRKGLIENSRDICRSVNRATTDFTAQTGVRRVWNPVLKVSCNGKKVGKKARGGKGRGR
ncbi:MAG: hypothetical protein QOF06_534 [Solirubrobacterales bacterium]|jgi:uncharacterized repeat protein (TIGR01451 family)|nr:hypothetical protein [Solirubrobacterales bacterium]